MAFYTTYTKGDNATALVEFALSECSSYLLVIVAKATCHCMSGVGFLQVVLESLQQLCSHRMQLSPMWTLKYQQFVCFPHVNLFPHYFYYVYNMKRKSSGFSTEIL